MKNKKKISDKFNLFNRVDKNLKGIKVLLI